MKSGETQTKWMARIFNDDDDDDPNKSSPTDRQTDRWRSKLTIYLTDKLYPKYFDIRQQDILEKFIITNKSKGGYSK